MSFLRVAYALDRKSRRKYGPRLTPWPPPPAPLPPLPSTEAVHDALKRLESLARKEPPGFRRDWLRDHVPTLRTLSAMVSGRGAPPPQQVEVLYDLPAKPADEEELEELRDEIRRILHVPKADELLAAVEAWEDDHAVPREAVPITMSKYLRGARRAPRRPFKLPPRGRVRLVSPHGRA